MRSLAVRLRFRPSTGDLRHCSTVALRLARSAWQGSAAFQVPLQFLAKRMVQLVVEIV